MRGKTTPTKSQRYGCLNKTIPAPADMLTRMGKLYQGRAHKCSSSSGNLQSLRGEDLDFPGDTHTTWSQSWHPCFLPGGQLWHDFSYRHRSVLPPLSCLLWIAVRRQTEEVWVPVTCLERERPRSLVLVTVYPYSCTGVCMHVCEGIWGYATLIHPWRPEVNIRRPPPLLSPILYHSFVF